ncbi:MAG: 2Fe-2S iron-sulfur cluster-binding protein [Bacteroidota bacterium]
MDYRPAEVSKSSTAHTDAADEVQSSTNEPKSEQTQQAAKSSSTGMVTVHFKFEDPSLEPKTVEVMPGLQIVEVTEEAGIHLNHNCGEVCACSTCHVYIESGEEFLPEITDREEDFIDRAINPRIESRLACQCMIEDENAVLEVTIPDQRKIIGHEH